MNFHHDAAQASRLDRDWGEGSAQSSLLALFGALGAAHPVTKKGRARLTNMLFV